MSYQERQSLFSLIEENRDTKVLSFITSDRVGMDTAIAQDCIDSFVNLLEDVGPTQRISLILHTNGGQTLAAWRLVNLIRMFCDEFEVLVPFKALSAGTLIALGADRVVMTKQAALGAIDPSVNNPLNPQVNVGNLPVSVPVSVENVRGFIDMARDELGIKGEEAIKSILLNLTDHIHPLVLGETFRVQAQIRFLAEKLLPYQVEDGNKIISIIDFLSAQSGSHDYTINRREASDLGLAIDKPSQELYTLLRKVHLSYIDELKLLEPYRPQSYLANASANEVQYVIPRAFVEGTIGGSYGFISEGTLKRLQVQGQNGVQEQIMDERTFEGWRKWQ